MRKKRTVHLYGPQNTVPQGNLALTKDNAAITSSDLQSSRKFMDAGKRTNSGGAARDQRLGPPIFAIDQHRSHAEGRRRREVEMLRIADMHRVGRGHASKCKGSVVNLPPRLRIAGFGGNRDRIEVTGQFEAVENSIQAIVEVGDHAEFESIIL
jgi:hypothetical protein